MSTLDEAKKKPARGRTGQRSNLEPGHSGEPSTASSNDGSVPESPTAGKRKPVARDYGGTTRSRISVAKIARHPQNRTPASADVDALAESLAREGMLEPVVVRPITGGWQLVSGETRVLAARKLGWREIDAHVVACEDARALELLAVYNAQRQDLTPIDKARLIRQLCLPAKEGGAGLTRLEAAKIYRLESHAAASNLVRLLELPEVWQQRVASGELPQSFARELLPLVVSPRLMQVLEDAWQNRPDGSDSWEDDPFGSRERVAELVRDQVRDHTRPVMQGHERGYSYQDLRDFSLCGEYPCLFELTDTLRATLDLVTINLAGKPVEVATDCELYDAYQIPAIKAYQRQANGARPLSNTDAASRSLSPKDRQEQLEKRIRRWRHAWLRSILVRQLEQPACGAWPAIKLLLWLQSHDVAWKFQHTVKPDATIADLADPGRRENAWAGLEAWTRRLGAGERLSRVAALVVQYSQAVLSAESNNPDLPILPQHVVDGLCRDYGVDVDYEWERMQSGREPADSFHEYFTLYQSDQLDKLGAELGVFVAEATTKAAKVKLFTTRDRILKRPKAIEGLEQTGPKKNARK